MKTTLALSTALSLLSLAPTAHAVQGDGPARSVDGERAARYETPELQRNLARQTSWQSFLARNGGSWTARWDEATGTPVRFYGSGWAVDGAALATDDGAFAIAEGILAREAGLLGRDVAPADLERGVVDRTAGITTVTFQQTWEGVRIDETRVSLRFKHDRFVMGQFETLPVLRDVPTRPSITKEAALVVATGSLGWDKVETLYDAELVILPIRGQADVTGKLAWRFDVANAAERSHPIVWVDAVSGRTLGHEEQIRYADGVVLGEIDNRYPEAGLAEVPMRFLPIEGQEGTAVTDTVGAFSLSGSVPDLISAEVGSEFCTLSSTGGDTTFAAFHQEAGGDVLFMPDPGAGNGAQRRERAELSVHHTALLSRERALLINPSFSWAQVVGRVNVNLNDGSCNAFFDPSNSPSNSNVNFLRQGGGCNNTGRVWDVMFHEYGHGFHIWSIVPGAGDFDGSLSEGLSDYLSATINGDNAMAPGFVQGNSNPLRDVGPNRVWPDDFDPQSIHSSGLIIAGALWDFRSAMEAAEGAAGIAHADQIFLAVAQRASDLVTTYDEALLADDDNGNLADGTPNLCTLNEQFGLHGLGPGGGNNALFGTDFEPASDLPVGEPAVLTLSAFVTNEQCANGDIGEVRINWTTEDGDAPSFEQSNFEFIGGDEWSFTTPAFDDGTYLRYTLEIFDTNGDLALTLPEGSITDPWYGAWAGGEVVWENDFETNDGDFSSALIQGGDQEGANDWMREVPKGGGGDPVGGASGQFAWGNDLQPAQNWNGNYQNDIHNVMRTGPIAAGDGGVHVQFRRWLTVEDGYWDEAWIEVNGTRIWDNFAGSNQDDSDNHHLDTHWAFRSYNVTDLVEGGEIEVEFHLLSDQGLTFGGWTIDDFRVVVGEGGGGFPGDDDDAAGDDDDAPGSGGGFGGSGDGCSCNANVANSDASGWALFSLLGGLVGLRRRR